MFLNEETLRRPNAGGQFPRENSELVFRLFDFDSHRPVPWVNLTGKLPEPPHKPPLLTRREANSGGEDKEPGKNNFGVFRFPPGLPRSESQLASYRGGRKSAPPLSFPLAKRVGRRVGEQRSCGSRSVVAPPGQAQRKRAGRASRCSNRARTSAPRYFAYLVGQRHFHFLDPLEALFARALSPPGWSRW